MSDCDRKCNSQCDGCHTLENCVEATTQYGDLILCEPCRGKYPNHQPWRIDPETGDYIDCKCVDHTRNESKPMSDDLRTRIAAVVADVMNGTPDKPERWDFLLADKIITQLGLESETSYGTTYPNAPIEDRKLTRYVTNWKADDE